MTRARRAPELSAILRIDSCCTTVGSPSSSTRPLDDFDDAPPFGLGERPSFHDAHPIALLGAVLVVRGDPFGADDLFAVEPVREAARQLDRHGLLALVAHHHARANLATAPHAC